MFNPRPVRGGGIVSLMETGISVSLYRKMGINEEVKPNRTPIYKVLQFTEDTEADLTGTSSESRPVIQRFKCAPGKFFVDSFTGEEGKEKSCMVEIRHGDYLAQMDQYGAMEVYTPDEFATSFQRV